MRLSRTHVLPILLGLIVATCFSQGALAHQPRIVSEAQNLIEDPEISKAYYAELTGEVHEYVIDETEAFSLYVGLLVPDLENIDKDVEAVITFAPDKESETTRTVAELLKESSEWERFYEPFAGDWYWEGPELRGNPNTEGLPTGIASEPGIYTITVSSPDNLGKYSLAVGTIETFPLDEVVHTAQVLPTIKADFFGKSPWSAVWNVIGLGIFLALAVISLFVTIIVLLVRGRKKNSKSSD